MLFHRSIYIIYLRGYDKINEEEEVVITLSFLGDIAFRHKSGNDFVYALSSKHDPFSNEIKEILHQSDLSIANLETSIVEDTRKVKPRSYNYSDDEAKPRAWFASDVRDLQFLKSSGIKFVTVANNHWFDADIDEKDIDRGIELIREIGVQPLIGKGNDYQTIDGDVKKTHTLDLKNIGPHRTAILTTNAALDVPYPCQNLVNSSSNSPCLGTTEGGETRDWLIDWKIVEHMIESIQQLPPSCDILIVSIHWGTQFQDEVEEWQIQIANRLFNLGNSRGLTTLIVGHHPHCLHGIAYSLSENKERNPNGIVAYSLGSTLWPYGKSPSSILQVKLLSKKIHSVCWIPTVMKKGVLHIANRKQSLEIRNHINELSGDLPDGYTKSIIC